MRRRAVSDILISAARVPPVASLLSRLFAAGLLLRSFIPYYSISAALPPVLDFRPGGLKSLTIRKSMAMPFPPARYAGETRALSTGNIPSGGKLGEGGVVLPDLLFPVPVYKISPLGVAVRRSGRHLLKIRGCCPLPPAGRRIEAGCGITEGF